MTANQFYEQLVRDLAVDMKTIEAARDRRDELRATVETVTRRRIAGADSFPAGALAMGLQIAPLNDVDVVLRVPTRLASWVHTPRQALIDVRDWLDEEIDAHFELTSHAIRLNYPDEDFTADLVVGYENPAGAGLLIPHCPEDKPWEHDWIRTHPALHRDLIKKRTEDLGRESRFAKEIRVLKHLNRQWKVEHDKKILSSHHTTSLAWHIFQAPFEFATGTTEFLDRAAVLVLDPLPNPSGVGDPITSRDPQLASRLLKEAGEITRRANESSDPASVLRTLFGDPKKLAALAISATVGVNSAGALVPGSYGGSSTPSVRSHGDGE